MRLRSTKCFKELGINTFLSMLPTLFFLHFSLISYPRLLDSYIAPSQTHPHATDVYLLFNYFPKTLHDYVNEMKSKGSNFLFFPLPPISQLFPKEKFLLKQNYCTSLAKFARQSSRFEDSNTLLLPFIFYLLSFVFCVLSFLFSFFLFSFLSFFFFFVFPLA